jgi:hypothetical protein
MENGPFIDGLPIKNGGSFHGKLLNNQRVTGSSINYLQSLCGNQQTSWIFTQLTS